LQGQQTRTRVFIYDDLEYLLTNNAVTIHQTHMV
jgi:hypothetical protein